MMEAGSAPPGIEAEIAAVRRRFVDRYGDDLSSLTIDTSPGRSRVSGFVIVGKQRRELERALRVGPAGGVALELDVTVLSELSDDDPRADFERLAHPGTAAIPIWTRRVDGQLATEWLAADGPVRILRDAEPRRLVQLPDATVGWCRRAAGTPSRRETGAAPVLRRLSDGAQIRATPSQRRALFAAARRAANAGITYRLGGRDLPRGVDCSAFVQGLLERQTGGLLPRHTGDQLRIGLRVARPAIAAGDLVFCRARDKNWLHVGLALDGADRSVAHACRLDSRVMAEPLGDFLERYRFLRAQRVLVEPGASEPTR